jgi:hypothetical protein
MKHHNPSPKDRSRSPQARQRTIDRKQTRRLLGKEQAR